MNKIFIKKTDRTPEVTIDAENAYFCMEYDSRPEDVRKFYYPIIEKLKIITDTIIQKNTLKYFDEKPFVFEFKMGYFNSSSAKFILDLLSIVQNFKNAGANIKINWFYFDDDEDMKEAGEDFSDFCDIKFNFFAIEPEE